MLDQDAIDAVMFDLDGTLMDTDDQAVERIALRLQQLHWPRPFETARRLLMLSETPANALLTLLDAVGLDEPLMQLTDRLCQLRGVRRRDFRIIAGAKEMLADLNGRYRLAVVTTRGLNDAEAFLDQHGLRGYFDVIVTRESTRQLKPHPEPIRHAANMLNIPAERCAMVGDTTVDVRAARSAGAKAIAVLCGFGELEELKRAGAHAILECTSQLPSLL